MNRYRAHPPPYDTRTIYHGEAAPATATDANHKNRASQKKSNWRHRNKQTEPSAPHANESGKQQKSERSKQRRHPLLSPPPVSRGGAIGRRRVSEPRSKQPHDYRPDSRDVENQKRLHATRHARHHSGRHDNTRHINNSKIATRNPIRRQYARREGELHDLDRRHEKTRRKRKGEQTSHPKGDDGTPRGRRKRRRDVPPGGSKSGPRDETGHGTAAKSIGARGNRGAGGKGNRLGRGDYRGKQVIVERAGSADVVLSDKDQTLSGNYPHFYEDKNGELKYLYH